MDNRLEEIKSRDAEHQGLTLIVHEDRRWLLGEIKRLRKALEDISESDHRNGYCGRVARRALAGEE